MLALDNGVHREKPSDEIPNDYNSDEFIISEFYDYIQEKSSNAKYYIADVYDGNRYAIKGFKKFMKHEGNVRHCVSFATDCLFYMIEKKNRESGILSDVDAISSSLRYRFSENGKHAASVTRNHNRRKSMMDISKHV